MKNGKNSDFSELDLVKNSGDWVSALRQNLYMILDQPGVTLRSLSDVAGVNYDTLKGFLYGDAKNCKLGTIVNIARAFGLSLDGLVGAGTVSDRERALVLNFRKLPPAIAYYYEWSLSKMAAGSSGDLSERLVPLLRPVVWPDGSLHISPELGSYDVTGLKSNISAKVKAALVLPCDYYMPTYSPYHVLFLANDREQLRGEHSVVLISGELIITEIKEGGCYSLRDGGFRCPLSSVDEVIGYIAGTCLLDEPVL